MIELKAALCRLDVSGLIRKALAYYPVQVPPPLGRSIKCQGDLEVTTGTDDLITRQGTVRVADIPVQKCASCGEVYYDLEVVAALERVANNAGLRSGSVSLSSLLRIETS